MYTMRNPLKIILLLCLLSTACVYAQKRKYFDYEISRNGELDWLPDIYGGKDEMQRFINDHLVYPANDLKNKKQGKVTLYLVVSIEGKLLLGHIVKSPSYDMSKEAMRLLCLITDWLPACKNELIYEAGRSLDINFSISGYKKLVKERGFDRFLYSDLPTDTSLAIYETAERPALFKNPDAIFAEFLYANLQYPETAARLGIEGNVKLSYVVEPNGQVSNIKIINSVNGGCDNEAIRVIGLSKWLPAIYHKQYVRYKMNFTLSFYLKNNFKNHTSLIGIH
jgi:TonB family protein